MGEGKRNLKLPTPLAKSPLSQRSMGWETARDNYTGSSTLHLQDVKLRRIRREENQAKTFNRNLSETLASAHAPQELREWHFAMTLERKCTEDL